MAWEPTLPFQIFQVLLIHLSATPAQPPVLPIGSYVYNSLFSQYPLRDSNPRPSD
jgi:hypothetical protein